MRLAPWALRTMPLRAVLSVEAGRRPGTVDVRLGLPTQRLVPMKLFITASDLYCKESGFIRTEQSRISVLKVMRLLQRQYPDHHLRHFTAEELTDFCLSRNPAPATVKKRKAHVRSAFEWFAWKGLIKDNPAAELKWTVKPGGGSVRLGNWLSTDQVADIYRSFDDASQFERRDRLIFWFAVLTGLRLFELEAITWKSFHDDFETVSIVGKGSKPARVALPPQLRQALREWRREAPLYATAVFPSVKAFHDFAYRHSEDRSYRLPGETMKKELVWDRPLGDSGIRYAVRRAGEAIGVRLAPHDLRRTYAGIMESQGSQLKDIQLALRHEHLATTDGYLKKNPARAAQVTAAFGIQII